MVIECKLGDRYKFFDVYNISIWYDIFFVHW